MARLSKRRPIFHSEADFQHELAWEIRKAIPNSQVRLEYPLGLAEQRASRLDIWLPNEEIAIELKYCTRKFTCTWNSESFELKGQSAQDTRRYDFLKDIQRLEQTAAKSGVALLLTNEPLYWQPPTKGWESTGDAAFRVHEGRCVQGIAAWSERASDGTTSGRRAPICLNGCYTIHWQDYGTITNQKGGHFRYVVVSVEP